MGSGWPMSKMSSVILSDEVARAATGQCELRATRSGGLRWRVGERSQGTIHYLLFIIAIHKTPTSQPFVWRQGCKRFACSPGPKQNVVRHYYTTHLRAEAEWMRAMDEDKIRADVEVTVS